MRLRTILVSLLLVATSSRAAVMGAPESGARTAAPASSPPADSTHRAPPTLQDALDHADSLLAKRGGPHADSARIYLTWDAPYGMPRASRTHTPRSHDPQGVDTLWLCFLPGRSSEGFTGFTADLYFRAVPGDTLGPWWHMERTAQNKGALTIEFGPDETFPQRQPWAVDCAGVAELYRTPASARLNLIAAVPYTGAVGINPDSVYTLCRVLLHHKRDLPGCSQPVCVEWARAGLAYSIKDEPTVIRGERFVGYAGGETVCESFLPEAGKAEKPHPGAQPRRIAPSPARSGKPGH